VVGDRAVFEPGDVAALAAKIEFLKSATVRKKLLQEQTSHIDCCFSWQSIASRILAATAPLLDGGRGRRARNDHPKVL